MMPDKWLTVATLCVVVVALFAFVIPPISATEMATVHWEDVNGNTITSARYDQTAVYVFDTMVTGCYPVWQYDDEFFLIENRRDKITKTWYFIPYYVDWCGGANGSTSIACYTSPKFFASDTWLGSGNMSLSTLSNYDMIEMDLYACHYGSCGNVGTSQKIGHSNLTLTNNFFEMSNIGDWAYTIGGDGLRYVIALIIIITLLLLPFLLLRRFNTIIEIIMFAMGLGISFFTGLLDLWVLFALGLGLVAVYFVMERGGI